MHIDLLAIIEPRSNFSLKKKKKKRSHTDLNAAFSCAGGLRMLAPARIANLESVVLDS